jgi:apolipoprotein N-acyltransferase
LGFLFLVPLLLAMEGKRPAVHFRMFFYFSGVSYLIILYWIPRVMVRYGGTTWSLGILGLACLAAFFSVISGLAGMLIGKISSRGPGLDIAFWIPTVWIAKDLVIEKIFSGFPWCSAGYSQFKNIYFTQWAEIGGIHLVSFLLIAANVLFYCLLKKKDKQTLLLIAAFFSAIYAGGFWLLKNHGDRTATAPWHCAGIIQPNSDHDQDYDLPRINATLQRLFRASRELIKSGAEFVVWPEFTVPIYPLQTPYFRTQFTTFSRKYAPLVAGFTDYSGGGEVYNSVMLFEEGEVEKYDKVHLTPFGEYVLFRRLLFFVKKITDEIGDFTPGKELHNLDLFGHHLATPICYEVIYPQLVRAMIAKGGEVIVTVSNDSWFGRSSAPYQHLAMAVFRSIENRRFVLRSTSNGISALIDPGGHIIKQSPLHKEQEFLASFQYLTGRTMFTRFGYLFPYSCLLLIMGKFIFIWARKKGKRYQP